MTELEYRKDIAKKMRALGLYKKEYEYTMNTLARCLADYEQMLETFEKSGGNIVIRHTNKGGASNAAKNPFYSAIETLRADILAYSREMGLTPASLKKINESGMRPKGASPLEALIKGAG